MLLLTNIMKKNHFLCFEGFKKLRRANEIIRHTINDHEADFSEEISRVQTFQGSFCRLETMETTMDERARDEL